LNESGNRLALPCSSLIIRTKGSMNSDEAEPKRATRVGGIQ
jgi:hypothetical protein